MIFFMKKYILQRVIWIFVILVTTLTITYVLLKLAPEYPLEKTMKRYMARKQVEDGYYTSEYYDMNNPEHMAYLDEISLEMIITRLYLL